MRLLALLFVSFTALGQEWPSKPVRIVVPFPPGGAADAMPRIAADTVYRAEPDGYTLLVTPPAPLVINPFLSKLPYDPAQFVPVGVIGSIPSVMLVHPKVAAGNVREFVELARTNPGKLNYASQGTTTVSFLTTEMFLAAAGGLKVTHIPYKGTAPALAVCGERRHPALPDVPAMAEIYPGFTSVAEALKNAEVQKRLAELSAEPIGMGPREFAQFMQEEAGRWRQAIRFAGVKPE